MFCPNKPHPILCIIDQIPDGYGILLDHCFSTCSLDPTHPDYWEEFKFKCLNLRCDIGEEDKKADKKDSQVGEGIEMVDLEEYESVHTQLHTESDATIENASYYSVCLHPDIPTFSSGERVEWGVLECSCARHLLLPGSLLASLWNLCLCSI